MSNRLRSLALCMAALALSSCTSSTDQIIADRIVVIENITVIDAVSGVRPSMDVILTGDTIHSVEPIGIKTHFVGEIEIIDGTGRYMIPGLWDAHVHLTYDETIGHEVFFPLSIAHGITSLRDTGGHLSKLTTARARAASDPTQPDLFVSGPLLDGKNRVYDGSSSGFPDLSIGLATPEDAVLTVDRLADEGVNFIKAYEMLSPEIFAAVTDQARKRGLPVAAHIPLSMTAEEAVDAGARDMQHLRNIELSCTNNVQDLATMRRQKLENPANAKPSTLRSDIHTEQRGIALPTQDDQTCNDLISLLADKSVYQTPTLTISRFFTRRLFEDPDFRTTFDLMPDDIAAAWKSRSASLSDRAASEAALAYDEWTLGMIRKLHDADVPVMAGTDAPIGFLTPGASLHEELAMLVDAGLPPLAALEAATLAPARFLGLEHERGTIEPNNIANLVILSADPIANIRNTRKIDAVIKSGHILDRSMLDQRLSEPRVVQN